MRKKPKSKEESKGKDIEPKEKIVRILKLESELEEEIEEAEEEKELRELSEFILPIPGNVSTTSLDQEPVESLESGMRIIPLIRDKEGGDVKYDVSSSGDNEDRVYSNIEPGVSEVISESRGGFASASEVEKKRDFYNTDLIPAGTMTHNRPDVSPMSHREKITRDAMALQTNFETGYEAEHTGRDSISKAEKRKYQIK